MTDKNEIQALYRYLRRIAPEGVHYKNCGNLGNHNACVGCADCDECTSQLQLTLDKLRTDKLFDIEEV